MATKGDELLRDLLRCVLKDEGFTGDPQITIAPGSEAGDGFLGINSAIEVQTGNKVLKLFAKAATKNETLRRQLSAQDIFGREIFFYETLHPEFLRFQLERNVERPFNNVPKCYLTSAEDPNEILIFENLKEQGYVLYGKKTQSNERHIEFVFGLYAKFHAISYAMKDQNPQLYSELTGGLNDQFGNFLKTSGVDMTYSHFCKEIETFFDPQDDAGVVSRIENLTELCLDTIRNADKFVDGYSVITHGDCWFNNFLFKYTDSDDLEDVKVLDWQMMRVNSPVCDLSYFFYGVASKASMDNLDFYLKTYHDALSVSIRNLGSDPEKLYPYSAFQEHWKKFSRFGLMMSFGILKVLLMEKEDVPNAAEVVDSGKNFGDAFMNIVCDDAAYKQKVRDVVEHFVYNNFI